MKTLRGTFPLMLLAALSATITAACADVTLPALIADNMVMQRGVPLPVWGSASPGERVTVSLPNDQAVALAGQDGQWQVMLKPRAAGGPFVLTAAGAKTAVRRNVSIGDVWLCGGQSNMEFTLRRASNGAEAIASSADSDLRLFKVRLAKPETPANDVQGTWSVSGPETTGAFSAVGYFFGRALRQAEHVPIGLISSNQGGTPAQAWTRMEALNASPELKRRYVDTGAAAQVKHDAAMAAYAAALATALANGTKPPDKPYSFWPYSRLYNGMIAPLTRFPIRGVIWFQGETNTHDPEGYRILLPAMIRDWRALWHEPEMPFLIAQLAPFGTHQGSEIGWALTREAQVDTAHILPNVGLAVTTDVGTEHDIHPTNKQPVGERLALQARKIAYGEKTLVASGPSYLSAKTTGPAIVVTFDSVGDGLTLHGGLSSDAPVPADKLTGFAISGTDGIFVNADAEITGRDTVTVSSPQVSHPLFVRYGFVNFPVVNLWNKNGLPATPFRTDTFTK